MIDDRQETPSSHWDVPIWNPRANEFGWRSYLGSPLRHRRHLRPTRRPSRAEDLEGLPPAFLSVGTMDGFCDEDIAYAQRLNQAGVPTELHVYPGAPHGFDGMAPSAVGPAESQGHGGMAGRDVPSPLTGAPPVRAQPPPLRNISWVKVARWRPWGSNIRPSTSPLESRTVNGWTSQKNHSSTRVPVIPHGVVEAAEIAESASPRPRAPARMAETRIRWPLAARPRPQVRFVQQRAVLHDRIGREWRPDPAPPLHRRAFTSTWRTSTSGPPGILVGAATESGSGTPPGMGWSNSRPGSSAWKEASMAKMVLSSWRTSTRRLV